jgi:uncharacterized protein (DUF58 family)
LLVLGVLGGAAAVGLDTSRTVAYQVFSFLLALVVISALGSLGFRARLGVRRVLPRHATVGEPLTYRLLIRNESGRLERGLVVLEDLADPRPSLDEFVRSREPGEERRNWFDRSVGWYRFTWLASRNRRALVRPQPLGPLRPRGEIDVRIPLTPLRRGPLRFTGVTIARPDPLGLTHALLSLPLPQTLLVLPRRYPVPRLPLPGARRYQPGGVTLASAVGESDEFVSLRDYRHGDPRRRIHWRSFARVGRPVVREYQDEFFVRHALVLDTFAADESDVFESAVSVAASLACSAETEDSLLDLMFVGPEAHVFTAGRGLGHTESILEVLASVMPCRDQPFAALHRAVVARAAALSGCLCVFLAWDAPRRDLVRHLRALGLFTRAFVILPADAAQDGAHAGDEVHRLVVGRLAQDLARL